MASAWMLLWFLGEVGASWGCGFTAAEPPEQLICGTWFTLVFLSSTGLSHLHPTGARWVQGESGRCYLCCISSLHVGAARARWEDRSLPAPAAGAWPQPLLQVPALLQPQLVLSPSPKSWGLLQGTGAAVPALLGKDQADTTFGEWLPVLNGGSLGQDTAPCAGPGWAPAAPQPCCPQAQLFWPLRAPQPCLGLPLTAVSRSWPGVVTCAGAAEGERGWIWPVRKSVGEFCNPSPWYKVTEAGADQTPCSWKLPASSRAGGCSPVGFTRASPCGAQSALGREGWERVLGQTQGRWLVLTCLQLVPAPGNGCSSAGWGWAQPAPRDGGTYRDRLGLHQPGLSCRAWAGRSVWILPALLRPCSHLHLHFLPVRLDGATWLPRCLHPRASWKRAKQRERGQQREHPASLLVETEAENWELFPGLPSATQWELVDCP